MSFWRGKTVLVTGHTGFKGSWLSLWLQSLGANVIGFALNPPTSPNLYELAEVETGMLSIIGDIRDRVLLEEIVQKYEPEIVFHLAAQPLLKASYIDPIGTYEVNVIGTANVLKAALLSSKGKVVVNITTDKCYDNLEWEWPYRESDALGGYDPYSSSKACSELVTAAFRSSYYSGRQVQLASARAGNVIGGGDWAADRLVSDIIQSILQGRSPEIRNPHAIRPWQHVLEPLCGYLTLAEKMWDYGELYSTAWNFGPGDEHLLTVGEITSKIIKQWGAPFSWSVDHKPHMHEAQTLKLDSSKAKRHLGWKTWLSPTDTVQWTVDWYQNLYANQDVKAFTMKQIQEYSNRRGS